MRSQTQRLIIPFVKSTAMAQSSSCSHTEMKVDCRSIYSRKEGAGWGSHDHHHHQTKQRRFRLTSRGASVGLPPADRCRASASHGARRGGRRHSCVRSEENPLWQRKVAEGCHVLSLMSLFGGETHKFNRRCFHIMV